MQNWQLFNHSFSQFMYIIQNKSFATYNTKIDIRLFLCMTFSIDRVYVTSKEKRDHDFYLSSIEPKH